MQFLDVSQLEAGAVKPQFEDFSIQENFTQDFHAAFDPWLYRKGIKTPYCFHQVRMSHSDPVLLEQIIGNFVANANSIHRKQAEC